MLNIALPKGRLGNKVYRALEAIGYECPSVLEESRQLVFVNEEKQVSYLLVKPSDVAIYVERGVADIGVVGKDTLMEKNPSLYEMLDLGYGKCRLCVAGYPGKQEKRLTDYNLRVATKYPHIARSYYGAKGQNIDIIELSGSVELGPLIGLSDVILDIVESGGTLRANGLVVLEEICEVSARLVVNRVSLKTKGDRIRPLMEKMRRQLNERKGEKA